MERWITCSSQLIPHRRHIFASSGSHTTCDAQQTFNKQNQVEQEAPSTAMPLPGQWSPCSRSPAGEQGCGIHQCEFCRTRKSRVVLYEWQDTENPPCHPGRVMTGTTEDRCWEIPDQEMDRTGVPDHIRQGRTQLPGPPRKSGRLTPGPRFSHLLPN